MRLDEWQKWLDSQFVDAEEIASSGRSASSPPAPAESLPPTLEFAAVQDNLIPMVVPPQAPPPPSAPPAPSSGALPASRNLAEELDVPAIERYLPYLRKRQGESAPENRPEPADTPEEPAVGVAAREPEAVEERAAPAVVETPVPAEEAVVEKVGEPAAAPAAPESPAPEAADRVREAAEKALEEEAEVLSAATASSDVRSRETNVSTQTPVAHRLSPDESRRQSVFYRRTRHARNVRPAELVEEMNAVSLWNLVPRHLNTLIDMGSDLELINRLLDPTLSLEDTARLLNVCPATIRRYTNKGLLSHQRTVGNQRRFKLSDVFAFLEAQSQDRK